MGEFNAVYVKLTLEDGKITNAEGFDPKALKPYPGKEVNDLRHEKITGIHGLGVSKSSPECVLIPVWTGSEIIYIKICPPF